MKFTKMVGAGNDFVFIDKQDLPKTGLSEKIISDICERRFGVGADGLVVLEATQTNTMVWDFYNQDGSKAEMCGNAVRCVFRYAERCWGWQEGQVKTHVGWVKGKVTDADNTQVSWSLQNLKASQGISLTLNSGASVNGQLIHSGVPHFVVNEQETPLTHDQCREIQEHPQFAPEKTNVTLYKVQAQGPTLTRSFERGVADFTLACGTGVIATALALGAQSHGESLPLQAPGGQLSVRIKEQQAELSGPAHWVFQGEFQKGERS